VIDIRNYGLIGAVELEPRAGKPGARAFEVFLEVLREGRLDPGHRGYRGAVAPLIIESKQISRIVETLAEAIRETA